MLFLFFHFFALKLGIHGNGIQIGGGSSGNWHSNLIIDPYANGFIVLPLGFTNIYNNIIIRPNLDGIFVDARYDEEYEKLHPDMNTGTIKNSYLNFFSNTIVRPGRDGIRCYHNRTKNMALNNLVVYEGDNHKGVLFTLGAICSKCEGNFEIKNLPLNSIFVGENDEEVEKFNFKLKIDSPYAEMGSDLSKIDSSLFGNIPYGIANDFNFYERPKNYNWSVGAHQNNYIATKCNIPSFSVYTSIDNTKREFFFKKFGHCSPYFFSFKRPHNVDVLVPNIENNCCCKDEKTLFEFENEREGLKRDHCLFRWSISSKEYYILPLIIIFFFF